MLGKKSWHQRNVTVTFTLLACIAVSAIGIARLSFGKTAEEEVRSLTILIEHYGYGPVHVEETITVPVENEVAGIPGISEIRSVSEYGKAKITCFLHDTVRYGEVYASVRHALGRTYEILPNSVQPPRIYSSLSSAKPLCIIALRPAKPERPSSLAEVREYTEREIKPALLRINGTGEIEIGGGSRKEIVVSVDTAKASAYGIDIPRIGEYIQNSQVIRSVGKISGGDREISLTIYGKGTEARDLLDLRIPLDNGRIIPLQEVADVRFRQRELHSEGKVNGRENILVHVKSDGRSSPTAVSKQIRGVLEKILPPGIDYIMLYDSGEIIRLSLVRIIKALAWSAAGVIMLYGLIFADLIKTICIVGFIITTVCFTLGLLSLFAVSIDHYILASIAVGIGLITDIGIILSRQRSLNEVRGPVISSVLTTIAVLVPLYWNKTVIPGGRQVATGLTVMSLCALAAGLVFLPAYFRFSRAPLGTRFSGCSILPRKAIYGLFRLVFAACKKRYFTLGLFGIMLASVPFITRFVGTDFAPIQEEDSVFAHLEFEPNASLSSVTDGLDELTEYLQGREGIDLINALSRPGSGEMSVRFTPSNVTKEEVIRLLRAGVRRINNCFLYISEGADTKERSMEIILNGPSVLQLRNLAKETAAVLQKKPYITKSVLHFKDPPEGYIFNPSREKCAYSGTSVISPARAIWWQLHGPVIVKWPTPKGEIDIRLKGDGPPYKNRADALKIPMLTSGNTAAPLSRFGSFLEKPAESRIYRRNRQRAVYMTIHYRTRNIEKIHSSLRNVLDNIPLPEAYSFTIDRKLLRFRQQIKKLTFLVVLAAVLVYMVLASQFENLYYPLIIIIIIPVNAFPPLVGLLISGKSITVAALIGLIMLCGTGVNNSILIVCRYARYPDKNLLSLFLSIRGRILPLLLTSGTTIIGTVPILLLRGYGAEFMKTISFVLILGTAGSVFNSFTITPALMSFFFSESRTRKFIVRVPPA